MPKLVDDPSLPNPIHAFLLEVREQLATLLARLAQCDAHIAAHAKNNTVAKRASELTGVGPLTARVLAATVPDAKAFKNERQFGAWLGRTPRMSTTMPLLDSGIQKILIHHQLTIEHT